ncbi:MATE family multidrug resistance protein [Cytobacillus firmus]|uniref:Probable multidrug resistance protein NorM n=2 Tax=Cytobacillus TaxID=2675230 RepID=A0A366JKY0_CYTFI|nr:MULTISPECIES: MATE family efflux transporter [Cytobacillus]RBP87362.1 MATE family multidrug resistance protein [Cytobacillus firmus]TDX37062.1 MATE family multidrug resistance protein [Cytobacillus oceanisediminis]
MKLATDSMVLNNTTSSCRHREYLVLAIPLIISGISTPILGAVDTAVVGRIPDPASIGGVAIGAVIFNTMYWLLGFLRVSTSGFTAQAEGANNQNEMVLSLLRPMILAILFGLFFIILQGPILAIALSLIGGSEAVSFFASSYFSVRIWGAPFILLSYVIMGWLIGMGKVRLALATQIWMNALNIILDLVFVLELGMGVKGVAYATLIAEISAVVLGAWLLYLTNREKLANIKLSMLLETGPILKMMKVNRDLFLRTVCLLTMTLIFTSIGASMGEVTLAANAILLQIHYIIAYLFGGFANASSILVGRAIGGVNFFLYKRAYTLSAQWGLGSAILLSLIVLIFGESIIASFTTITEVKAMSEDFLVWMLVFPIFGFWGLQLEGIFSGATEAKSIRDSIGLSLIIFLIALWVLVPHYENHGLWIAFVVFSLFRSFFLSLFIPKLTRKKFTNKK